MVEALNPNAQLPEFVLMKIIDKEGKHHYTYLDTVATGNKKSWHLLDLGCDPQLLPHDRPAITLYKWFQRAGLGSKGKMDDAQVHVRIEEGTEKWVTVRHAPQVLRGKLRALKDGVLGVLAPTKAASPDALMECAAMQWKGARTAKQVTFCKVRMYNGWC